MADQHETLERVRRIETRVTKIGNHLGVDVGGGKPAWDPLLERVMLPSPNCSIKECLSVIPSELRGVMVKVYVGNDHLTTIGA